MVISRELNYKPSAALARPIEATGVAADADANTLGTTSSRTAHRQSTDADPHPPRGRRGRAICVRQRAWCENMRDESHRRRKGWRWVRFNDSLAAVQTMAGH